MCAMNCVVFVRFIISWLICVQCVLLIAYHVQYTAQVNNSSSMYCSHRTHRVLCLCMTPSMWFECVWCYSLAGHPSDEVVV